MGMNQIFHFSDLVRVIVALHPFVQSAVGVVFLTVVIT